jgi:23S rRNA pseudouridine1911/1915/1917 synthase
MASLVFVHFTVILSLFRPILSNPNFTVLAETDDYIVVNKPAPLLIHPSVPGNPPTLLCGMQALLAYEIANGAALSIINRLDRETSGLVLVAKHVSAARNFSRAMERRQSRKQYLAIVWGWPTEDRFTVDAPLIRAGEVRESPIWLQQTVHETGSPSRSEFEVVARFTKATTNGSKFSLLHVKPHTGRMHQIRVHAAHAGFPLVGDKIYGPTPEHYLEHIETGWTPALEQSLLLPRHALHSVSLSIPFGETTLHWNAPLQDDLQNFLPHDIAVFPACAVSLVT